MNYKAKILIRGGLLLLAAALCTAVYHLWDGSRAAGSAEAAVRQIENRITASGSDERREGDAETDPSGLSALGAEMPVLEIDGNQYIGTLVLDSLGVTVPVMSEWSYPKLKLSPCRFSGCAYLDDMIIAGHNYPAHFGNLKELEMGDPVVFTDAEGRSLSYTVSDRQTLKGTELEALHAGDWDLTLFTCTADGSSRVTVRCKRAGEP